MNNLALAVVGLVGLVLLLAGQIVTAALAFKTLNATTMVVKHTNHMKDELVAEVRAASLAKGAEDERTREAVKKRK